MRRLAVLSTLLGLLVASPGVATPQGSRPPAAPSPAVAVHGGDLDCRQCHQGNHQGVVRMYLGMGGRGTPMIPSHMFQVRVQCVACHIAPKGDEGPAPLVAQTFRPTDQACVDCHGEKYRGMLRRWADTLGQMREILAPKLAAARVALAESGANPKQARARDLTNDAEYNIQFVVLGKGVHNVFYAADLLKLANGWLDEALPLLGKSPIKGNDALVRGGYCAVMCHSSLGVRQRETVTFQKRALPHVRHVTEFGAVCTACHSAETHKVVSATPATCTACHHSAQNDRCESCHRAQSDFYRGRVGATLVKMEPNPMAAAVGCTGCHDWSKKHSRRAVGEQCVGCHDAAYMSFFSEWTTGLDRLSAETTQAVKRAGVAVARQRRARHPVPEIEALLRQAQEALGLVQRTRGVHNPAGAEALLEVARQKADTAAAEAGKP